MKPHHMLFAALVALIWGANFAASKFAVAHFPPVITIFFRYALVAAVLLPFYRVRPMAWKPLSILALLMCTLHFCLVFGALWMGLDVASTVIAIQMGTPFTVVLSTIFLKDRIGMWRVSGMAISFMGIMLVAGTPSVLDNYVAFLLAVGGAFCWASSNVYAKTMPTTDVMPLLAWSSLAAVPQLALISLVLEGNYVELVRTAPFSAWAGIFYSAMGSTIVGYGLWYYLLKQYEVSQVAPFALLVPVAGFSAGIIFFDEQMTVKLVVGALITIIGVGIITFRKPKLVGRMNKV